MHLNDTIIICFKPIRYLYSFVHSYAAKKGSLYIYTTFCTTKRETIYKKTNKNSKAIRGLNPNQCCTTRFICFCLPF